MPGAVPPLCRVHGMVGAISVTSPPPLSQVVAAEHSKSVVILPKRHGVRVQFISREV